MGQSIDNSDQGKRRLPTPLSRLAMILLGASWLFFAASPLAVVGATCLLLVTVISAALEDRFHGKRPVNTKPVFRAIGSTTLFLLVAILWCYVRRHPEQTWDARSLNGETVTVFGTVKQTTEIPPPVQPATWDAIPAGWRQVIEIQQGKSVGQLTEELHGDWTCYLEDRSLDRDSHQAPSLVVLNVGDTVRITGKYHWPNSAQNPGEFDFSEWLAKQGIVGQLNIKEAADVTVVSSRLSWETFGLRLKSYFRSLVNQRIPEEQRDVAAAVLLGDRSLLTTEKKQQFATSGTIHLLAISGLHIGILAGALGWLGIILGVPRTGVYCFVMFLVVFYAWLVEFRPPVVRAAVLTVVFCMAGLLHRRAFSLNSLAAAIVVLFLMQPVQLVDAGTHLSFLAVAAMVSVHRLGTKPLRSPLERLVQTEQASHGWFAILSRSVKTAYLHSTVVFLVCLPLVVHHFHLAAWVGLLVNPILVPLMAVALLSGFLMLVSAPFFEMLSYLAGSVAGGALDLTHQLVEWANAAPFSYTYLASPGQYWTFAWYLLLVSVCWWFQGRLRQGWLLIGFLGLFVLVHAFAIPGKPDRIGSQPQVTVTFLDVGHGNCTIIRSQEGKVMVCDAGSFPSSRSATRKVSGTLWAHGIQRIDSLVISHADLDHYNAVPALLERFSVRQIIVPIGMFESTDRAVEQLRILIDAYGIETVELADGDTLPEFYMEVKSPYRDLTGLNDNARSLVLELSYGGNRIMLTGDVEGAPLDRLLKQPQANVLLLQVPHHGSKNNRPEDVVPWASPKVAVVSALQKRVPKKTMDLLAADQIDTLIPNRDGAVLLNLYSDGESEIRRWNSAPWPTR